MPLPSRKLASPESEQSARHRLSTASDNDGLPPTFSVRNQRGSLDGASDDSHGPPSSTIYEGSAPPNSAPASVVSFSGSAFFSEEPLYRRNDSRASVHSVLRQTATNAHEQPEDDDSVKSLVVDRASVRTSFNAPRARRRTPLHESTIAPSLSDPSADRPRRRLMRSSMLMGPIEKPWLSEKDKMESFSNWIVYFIAFLGIAGSAVRCYFGYVQTPLLGKVCLVLEDNFDTFDTENVWQREVSMSGFGCVFLAVSVFPNTLADTQSCAEMESSR